MPFEFKAATPKQWTGRYSRPMGEESAYHVSTAGEITVRWREQGCNFDCPILHSEKVSRLATAVNKVKLRYAGMAGGSFIINEYGQVICPIANSREKYFVGECSGPIEFEDPWNDGVYLSTNPGGMRPGASWKRPYMGVKYNLSKKDEIYFWHENGTSANKILPSYQDDELIEALREVRAYGPVSFVVNHHGIAVAKKNKGWNAWEAVYVGRINYSCWFPKER